MTDDKCREALEDMVWHFAFHGLAPGGQSRLQIWTGGLIVLEKAFEALGWENPHVLDEEVK